MISPSFFCLNLPIIVIIIIIISRFITAFDSRPIIVLSQFLKPFHHFGMNSLEEEPAFIHRSVFPAMFKSVETLQEFLIIKEHLTSSIGVGTSSRSTSSFDGDTEISRFQNLLGTVESRVSRNRHSPNCNIP